MKTRTASIFLILLLMIGYDLAIAQVKIISKSTLAIGETISFQSKNLSEKRTLNVYLPNGYSADSAKNYPVIYLLDGSIDEDIIHISGLVQFGSFSWIKMLPESIVVGISNVDRKHDFTFPSKNDLDQKEFPTSGGSSAFIRFIKDEVQPLINETYNTTESTTLIGQSLGGLVATEILFKQPDLFDNYIIVSPSLWWDDESLLDFSPVKYETQKHVYIGVGKEGEVMERTAFELYSKLNNSKGKNTQLYYKFLEAQNHGDALHLAVYDAFEMMYRNQ